LIKEQGIQNKERFKKNGIALTAKEREVDGAD